MPKPMCRPLPEILRRPMKPRRAPEGLLGLAAGSDKYEAEFAHRFQLLIEHYGVNPESDHFWRDLAIRLIDDFVPGLREGGPERRGRPANRRTADARLARRALLVEVEAIQGANPAISQTAALLRAADKLQKRALITRFASISPKALRDEIKLARQERWAEKYANMPLALLSFGLPADLSITSLGHSGDGLLGRAKKATAK